MIWKSVIRPIFFALSRRDPERIHEFVLNLLGMFGKVRPLAGMVRSITTINSPQLPRTVFGLHFPSPVGLAAGFDKNAQAVQGLAALGFGFVEVGTVTQHPQAGNPRPRMFRLAQDEALINRMGFNNYGADALAEQLAHTPKLPVPLGINIGKSKITPIEQAAGDYLYSFERLYPFGDYFVINVSSPNTPGLRTLQEKPQLDALLSALRTKGKELADNGQPKPILVKIAPDLTQEAVADVLAVCADRGLDGIIATNTTLGREGLKTAIKEDGGLSGRPLTAKSRDMVRFIRSQDKKLPIIGVGGIFTGRDAAAMLDAGANLVQVYTSFVYEGPFVAKKINHALIS